MVPVCVCECVTLPRTVAAPLGLWLSPAQPGLMTVLRRGAHPSRVTRGAEGAAKNAQGPHHPVAHTHMAGAGGGVPPPQACLGEDFCTHSSAGLSLAWLEGLCVYGGLWQSVFGCTRCRV